MFKLILPFDQRKTMHSLRKLIDANPGLAKCRLPFIEGSPTVEDLMHGTYKGWCWGICAALVAHVTNPLKSPIATVEACKGAFIEAIEELNKSLVETMYFQYMHRNRKVPKEQIHINPADMQSPFSLWTLEGKLPGERLLHAILTSNKTTLKEYLIFDSNYGLYKSTQEYTRELKEKFSMALFTTKSEAQARMEVIMEAALAFASSMSLYNSYRLSLMEQVPYMGSRGLFDMVQEFRAKMGGKMFDSKLIKVTRNLVI